MRLTGGSGTPCDPLHSGFVEVYHAGEWGRICLGPFESRAEPADTLVADVACRQLGFPHGTLVIPGNGPGVPMNMNTTESRTHGLPKPFIKGVTAVSTFGSCGHPLQVILFCRRLMH